LPAAVSKTHRASLSDVDARHQRGQKPKPPVQLRKRVKHQRRHDSNEDSTCGASCRDKQIERSKVPCRRAQPIDFTLANHAAEKQGPGEAEELLPERSFVTLVKRVARQGKRKKKQQHIPFPYVPCRPVKTDNKCQKIKA